jgi:glycosyltransferase involved in cell wall biosynthesis
MIDSTTIAVVIPAKDEAAHIAEVVTTLPDFVDHVVVVDDGSQDDTAGHARRANCDVVVVQHRHAKGVGAAIVAGYRQAIDLGADVAAVMAGDGQMDPGELDRVVAPIIRGRAGYVKGNRLRDPDVLRVMPWPRLCGTAVLGALTARVVGVPIGDSQCGYTAIAAEALAAIDLDGLWPGYGYPNDLLAALGRAGILIEEVVVRPIYRGEASGLKARHVAVIMWLLARAAWRRAAVTSGS